MLLEALLCMGAAILLRLLVMVILVLRAIWPRITVLSIRWRLIVHRPVEGQVSEYTEKMCKEYFTPDGPGTVDHSTLLCYYEMESRIAAIHDKNCLES
jgi:hypothetical protein